jgi:hypothetical protein
MCRLTKMAIMILATLAVVYVSSMAEAITEEGPPIQYAEGRELGYRFLWPADPSSPGRGLVELEPAKTGSKVVINTPLGPAEAVSMSLRLPSGQEVAATRVMKVLERDRVWVFETEIKEPVTSPTGKYERPHFALPALAVPRGYRHVLDFVVEEFVTPIRYAVPTTGPVLMYTDDLEVIVFSSLDRFMAAMQAPVGKEWHLGFGGEIKEIPAGTVTSTLVVAGNGINSTFMHWGKAIQDWHGHKPADPYADVTLSRLGYWTDNGSYYYYRTEPGMNYHDTLLAVKEYADREDIPYGYFQIDSWWYPKAEVKEKSSHNRGGYILWEPNPEMFPRGLAEFTKELGLPLVAHNRYCSNQSPYCDRYKCAPGDHKKKQAAHPVDPVFWDEIMDKAVDYGVVVYEQDWLYTHMDIIPWMRSGLQNGEVWYDAMASAADQRGLTMQLCMASPEFFLQQLKHPNETHARVSHDYKGGLPKAFFWMPFHKASLFAWAVGLWPFKDNFQSTAGQRPAYNIIPEANPWEEALVACLSGGPVGPSDRIGGSDRALIMRTCRKDGVLLKPDRPATPIDIMFLYNKNIFTGGKKPWVVTTESEHEIGKTTYLAAFNLWPLSMYEPYVTLEEAGVSGPHLLFEHKSGESKVVSEKVCFGWMPPEEGFYYVLCPVLENGMAVIGEIEKFATMSKKRFPSVRMEQDALVLEVEGVPGEGVTLAVYAPGGIAGVEGVGKVGIPRELFGGIMAFDLQIPESGKTLIRVR